MLVLARRKGEELVIGDQVSIRVIEIGSGRVRLGIQAPADVEVDRREVRQKKIAQPSEQKAVA